MFLYFIDFDNWRGDKSFITGESITRRCSLEKLLIHLARFCNHPSSHIDEKARDGSVISRDDVSPSAKESYICRQNFAGKTSRYKFAEVAARFDGSLSK